MVYNMFIKTPISYKSYNCTMALLWVSLS